MEENLRAMYGFHKLSPDDQSVERRYLQSARKVFESRGYMPLETSSVQPLRTLIGQGDTTKEIYCLAPHFNDPAIGDQAIGLRFDLTVPFARFVAENHAALTFPLKRHEMGNVWRQERPEAGRLCEFRQCDIDVVGRGELSPFYDHEIITTGLAALSHMNLGPLKLRLNNRKVLHGVYEILGLKNGAEVMRIVDSVKKIGDEATRQKLKDEAGLSESDADKCVIISKIEGTDSQVRDELAKQGLSGKLLEEGLSELSLLYRNLEQLNAARFVVDMSLTRGMNYYTGNIFETNFDSTTLQHVKSSIFSGGRYEDLIGDLAGTNIKMPGVGATIGLSCILSILKANNSFPTSSANLAQVMVAHTQGATWQTQEALAEMFRNKGLKVEIYPEALEIEQQRIYAQSKGIPFVLLFDSQGEKLLVEDIRKGEQTVLEDSPLINYTPL